VRFRPAVAGQDQHCLRTGSDAVQLVAQGAGKIAMSRIESPDQRRWPSISPGDLVRLRSHRALPQGACRVRYLTRQGVVIDVPGQDRLVRFEDVEAVLPQRVFSLTDRLNKSRGLRIGREDRAFLVRRQRSVGGATWRSLRILTTRTGRRASPSASVSSGRASTASPWGLFLFCRKEKPAEAGLRW